MEIIRTCLVCRAQSDKRKLIRIVKNKDGEIFIDKTGKANGRGAYICDNDACITKMLKNRLLNKAYKTNINENIYSKLCEDIKLERKS